MKKKTKPSPTTNPGLLSAVVPPVRGKQSDDNDETEEQGITVLGDHIWFYSPITPSSAMRLNRSLQDLSMRLAPTAFSSMQEVGSPAPIWLHINSYGGEVFSSFAVADTIERISQIVPIITIVEGCAASGATFMSIAATRRLIRKNALCWFTNCAQEHGAHTPILPMTTQATQPS